MEDVNRRRFLAAAAATLPAALAGEVPAMVGASDVAAVRDLALTMDLTTPFAVGTAHVALQRALGMLSARATTAVAADLNTAVALLADRVGWGMHETGHDARETLLLAQRLAGRGTDPDLQAHALLDLAVATPDPKEAVATLDHALTMAVSGGERLNLMMVAARRIARTDHQFAMEYLRAAADMEPTPVGQPWAGKCTDAPGHLDAVIGFANYAVGSIGAGAVLQRALDALPSTRRRIRARCHTRLAAIALRNDDETAAATHVWHAIHAPQSTMVRADLRSFAKVAKTLGYRDLSAMALGDLT